ncbi:MAG: hypothetical protein A2Z49_12245 [Chloroflexi bacterium RBG_19FT_COMBO_56_12]|nr:MAG: hypothetical protein A2Y53_06940 [Chloroflexi bacterium RBG_16_47_49]OGO71494.1 MAG: hypothetical protein A2Z49_12245 [Chloroflexi bacterium RBG_19FT_COMBO_56_12]
MSGLEYRNTQTQVKHEILMRYLDTWGGIILRGLSRSNRQHGWHFIYVDCFAYKGIYAGDQEDFLQHRFSGPVFGSAIIGVQALDKLAAYAANNGIHICTNAITIEKDPGIFRELEQTFQKYGFGGRIRKTADFSSLSNGEIALINGDSTKLVDKLLAYTDNKYTWAFYLLDPYGASGIPYDFVKKIVSGPRHDVMINFIYEDFLRKTGMALMDSLNPKYKQLVDLWKKAFGDHFWNQIVLKTLQDIRDHRNWRDALEGVPLDDMKETDLFSDSQLTEIKERSLIFGYQKVLQSMDPEIAIKLSALRFPDKERTMFYLFLTTHDPTGALQLNQILRDAKLLEYELRFKLYTLRHVPPGQLSLFDPLVSIPKPSIEERPTSDEVASVIYQRLQGKSLTRKQIYANLTDTLFFPLEIDSALKLLKRNGKLSFDGNQLNHRTQIRFTFEIVSL